MHHFLRYLELVLTAAGLLVVSLVFYLFRQAQPWQAAAICAVVVGVIHGIIFFAVRRAQREQRMRALRAIRHMLDDLVRNKLQVVLFATEIHDQDWRPAAQRAVQEIQNRLNFIEIEALTAKGMFARPHEIEY